MQIIPKKYPTPNRQLPLGLANKSDAELRDLLFQGFCLLWRKKGHQGWPDRPTAKFKGKLIDKMVGLELVQGIEYVTNQLN